MATRSSVLAWRIPGTGEPGGLLQDLALGEGLQRAPLWAHRASGLTVQEGM